MPSGNDMSEQQHAGLIILLVEDDPDDALITQRVLKGVQVDYRIIHLGDGEQAIHYLGGKGEYADRQKYPLPGLVLLDLKMPRITGLEVLAWLQERPDLAHIPVIVLTGSVYEEDHHRARALGAVGFEVKPVGLNALSDIIKRVVEKFVTAKEMTGNQTVPKAGGGSKD